MSQLKNWTKVNGYYIDSQPEKILQEYYRANPKSFWKMLSFSVIMTVGIVVVNITDYNGYLLATLIAIFAITVMWKTDDVWSKHFRKHNLLCLPYFARFRLLHYIRFKNKCDEDNIFNKKQEVVNLIDWQTISAKKFKTFLSFSSSKLHQASIAYFISVGVYFYSKEDFKIGFDLKIEHYLSILFLAVFFYFVIYWIYSVSRIYKRNDFKVCKFLEMYKKEIKAD